MKLKYAVRRDGRIVAWFRAKKEAKIEASINGGTVEFHPNGESL